MKSSFILRNAGRAIVPPARKRRAQPAERTQRAPVASFPGRPAARHDEFQSAAALGTALAGVARLCVRGVVAARCRPQTIGLGAHVVRAARYLSGRAARAPVAGRRCLDRAVPVTNLELDRVMVRRMRRRTMLCVCLLDANLETVQWLGSAIAQRDAAVHNYRAMICSARLAGTLGSTPKPSRASSRNVAARCRQDRRAGRHLAQARSPRCGRVQRAARARPVRSCEPDLEAVLASRCAASGACDEAFHPGGDELHADAHEHEAHEALDRLDAVITEAARERARRA